MMDKNDFDIDFDFEKEYGFDPSLFLSEDDTFDYDQFLNEATGELPEDLSETAIFAEPVQEPEQPEEYEEAAPEEEIPEEKAFEEELVGDPEYDEDDDIDFITHVRPEPAEAAEPEQEFEIPEEDALTEEEYSEEEPSYDADGFQDEAMEEAEEEQEEAKPRKRKKSGKSGFKMPDLGSLKGLVKKKEKPEEDPEEPAKPKKQSTFSKLLDLYMEPVTRTMKEDDILDPLDPKYIRRKKREKKRIFKEVYLPAIIAGVALFLILSFVVGFTSNLIRQKKVDNAVAKLEQQNEAEAANRAEAEYQHLLLKTDAMVQGYDYQGAIDLLEDFLIAYPKYADQIAVLKAEYSQAERNLVEVKDTSTIANLSFHVLIADPSRAFSESQLGPQYNKNFVTVEEFSRILDQLYTGNYVLVDYNSFISNEGVDGNDTFFVKPLKLPQGKKPIMITETMVNYFEYMVDSNSDGEPDAGGHGFANKLVLDENGDIKAAIVDKDGVTQVGNYDLVPVLEDFIAEHPDFSYRGARATLAVTGSEGVFGYRTNTSYVATRGQSYYDNEVMEAKKIVQALRDKGYTLASYTYNNVAYHGMSTVQIQAEMQNWSNQCTPVLGDVDVMVFARASDIDAYSGTSFNVLYSTGFRYFMNNGTSPRVDVTTGFVKQSRLMVTGEAMAWYSSQFSPYFDCNMVLDLTGRGKMPAKS